ncbi:MAG: hypothetical protein JNL14_16445 [Devosia sp.]|uniref:hypothetical protein n=1 Tax=Devosia sp. TaxID=1871048 RepID=UPI001A5334E9|nr:hypothetical protein [Devosia sp.]MBL8599325.1 hypothetical protein [Devosia sp.]
MPMEALMGVCRRTTLSAFATIVLTSAALAAPNGTPDPVADCANKAAIQYSLDYAMCHNTNPNIELRQLCQAQATAKYSLAVAACGNKSSSVRTGVTPGLKQNTDSGFVRRLRY